jgi:hypothetical protein
MRATVTYGAGDVRMETLPDPVLQEPTDAVVRVVRACVCDSDRPAGCAVGEAARRRTDHPDGPPQGPHRSGPRVRSDRRRAPDGYRAMDERAALKVLVTP